MGEIELNIEQALQNAKEQLKSKNIDATNEIPYLLMHVLQMSKAQLLANYNLDLSEKDVQQFQGLIDRKLNHEPLAYILGTAQFMGLDFYVSPDVLIPRWETELLVEEVMAYCKNDAVSVIDMCTGSGCILISLLKLCEKMQGIGVDISGNALTIAEKNTIAHQVTDRVSFVKSNMFENLQRQKVDIIVSNPPYIDTKVMQTLDKSVLDYEPHLALDGKDKGLYFYEEIAKKAPFYLKNGGVIFLEIGYDQGDSIKEIFKDYGNVVVKKDYAGFDRVGVVY